MQTRWVQANSPYKIQLHSKFNLNSKLLSLVTADLVSATAHSHPFTSRFELEILTVPAYRQYRWIGPQFTPFLRHNHPSHFCRCRLSVNTTESALQPWGCTRVTVVPRASPLTSIIFWWWKKRRNEVIKFVKGWNLKRYSSHVIPLSKITCFEIHVVILW